MGIVWTHESKGIEKIILSEVEGEAERARAHTLYLLLNLKRMLKVGILGGGQLGRMLLQAAANYPVETFLMENDPECPAAHLCHHFTQGDIRNYDDVYRFGKDLQAITIEIESVNEQALEKLESEGVKLYPRSSALKIIKNKILQKQFYKENQIPTADFIITQNKNDLKDHHSFYQPFTSWALAVTMVGVCSS